MSITFINDIFEIIVWWPLVKQEGAISDWLFNDVLSLSITHHIWLLELFKDNFKVWIKALFSLGFFMAKASEKIHLILYWIFMSLCNENCVEGNSFYLEQTWKWRREWFLFRTIIRSAVNASEHDAVIFVGSGATSAVHKFIHALRIKTPPVRFNHLKIWCKQKQLSWILSFSLNFNTLMT